MRWASIALTVGHPTHSSRRGCSDIHTIASAATSGLLGVFGALLRRPVAGRGRDLDHLGLGELTLREVRELFHDGWQSALWRRVARA